MSVPYPQSTNSCLLFYLNLVDHRCNYVNAFITNETISTSKVTCTPSKRKFKNTNLYMYNFWWFYSNHNFFSLIVHSKILHYLIGTLVVALKETHTLSLWAFLQATIFYAIACLVHEAMIISLNIIKKILGSSAALLLLSWDLFLQSHWSPYFSHNQLVKSFYTMQGVVLLLSLLCIHIAESLWMLVVGFTIKFWSSLSATYWVGFKVIITTSLRQNSINSR